MTLYRIVYVLCIERNKIKFNKEECIPGALLIGIIGNLYQNTKVRMEVHGIIWYVAFLATKVRMEVDCSNRLLNPHKRKVQNGKGHLPVILGDRDAFDMYRTSHPCNSKHVLINPHFLRIIPAQSRWIK